jgi:hypothetical protein
MRSFIYAITMAAFLIICGLILMVALANAQQTSSAPSTSNFGPNVQNPQPAPNPAVQSIHPAK